MTTSVKVIHGPNVDIFDLPEATTIANVRRSLVDAFNIPSAAISFVNGVFANPGYRLMTNDSVEFITSFGVKSILDPEERAQLDRIEEKLNRLFAKPANGSPGRSVETMEIAAFVADLKRNGLTWKEVLKSCRERWPNDPHVKNADQLRATFRRFFKQKPN